MPVLKQFQLVVFVSLSLFLSSALYGQTSSALHSSDDQYKVDVMVVVAHPDDEAGFTPFLARAIYDMHKRVAVIFATHGGSGGNNYGREHGPALSDIREIEARQACVKLGITNVWFLDGKDTASQDVLYSLANWGHGANLERLVGLIRLTRPEVVMTNLPGIFIGENHGDHQASGVLTTEAFDLAGDPTAFPAQVAGDMRRNETFLENMLPWQPKKLFYSDDTPDTEKLPIVGPSYSVREISPSQKKPYWRLALDSATAHMTQFPEEIRQLSKMSDAELEKMMNDPQRGWWTEPMTFIQAKSVVPGKPTDDVFAHLDEAPENAWVLVHRRCDSPDATAAIDHAAKQPSVELGGPWLYLKEFRAAHGLCGIPVATNPEIGIKAGGTVSVPLTVFHGDTRPLDVTVSAKAPEGWKVKAGAGKVALPKELSSNLRVDIDTPTLSADQLKERKLDDVTVEVEAEGKQIGEVRLKVRLGSGGLLQ